MRLHHKSHLMPLQNCSVRPWFHFACRDIEQYLFFHGSISKIRFELLIGIAYKFKCKNTLSIQPQIRNKNKENISTPKRMTIKCTLPTKLCMRFSFVNSGERRTTLEKRAKLNALLFFANLVFFYSFWFCFQFTDWRSDISVNMDFEHKMQCSVYKR